MKRSLLLLTILSACAPVDEIDTDLVIAPEDGKFDSDVRARVGDLTLWVDPTARLRRGAWVLEGRTNRDLTSVFASVPDDAFCRAELLAARRFEIACDASHELNTMLSGLPLFVSLTPASGRQVNAALWWAPRFTRFSGTSRVTVKTAIERVWVARELVYRGRAQVASGYGGLQVPGTRPVTERAGWWHFDFSFSSLPLSRSQVLIAGNSSGTVEKSARIEVAIEKLGLTTRDPSIAWPNECSAAVARCLDGLSGLDTERCGSYRQVLGCGGVTVAEEPSRESMVAALRDELVRFYDRYGADIAASGGNTLAQAQAAVDGEAFRPVTNPDDDPNGHDLSTLHLYSHADPVWPGGDTTWYVAFDRATGQLLEVYSFN